MCAMQLQLTQNMCEISLQFLKKEKKKFKIYLKVDGFMS